MATYNNSTLPQLTLHFGILVFDFFDDMPNFLWQILQRWNVFCGQLSHLSQIVNHGCHRRSIIVFVSEEMHVSPPLLPQFPPAISRPGHVLFFKSLHRESFFFSNFFFFSYFFSGEADLLENKTHLSPTFASFWNHDIPIMVLVLFETAGECHEYYINY